VTGTEENKKRALIVSFNFPPLNSIGALRIGKFAKYLPEFGWDPIVLTVDHVGHRTQTLPIEIDELNVIRTPYFGLVPFLHPPPPDRNASSSKHVPDDPDCTSRASRLLRPIRHPYFIGTLVPNIGLEAWGWYPYAIRKGRRALKETGAQVIFSSFSPRISHIVGSKLHRSTGTPWVADFRDLWSLNPFTRKARPYHFLERRFEQRTMKGSSLLISVSEPLAEQLESLHSKKAIVIPNGFDEEDYLDDVPLLPKLAITYTGQIYPGKRDPTPLFEALAELRNEGRVSPNDLEARFFTTTHSATISSLVEEHGLQDLVTLHDPVPFEESVRRQKESAALLLLEWNDPRAEGNVTAKIFEYMGAGRPILAIAFEGGEIPKLLERTGTGTVATKVGQIKQVLSTWIAEFTQHGHIMSYYNPNSAAVKQYTRREQARKLAAAFDEVTSLKKGREDPLA
jgi:glycosyltransferase involved in cell wall biosynthesis